MKRILFALLLLVPGFVNAQTITTVAGTGMAGYNGDSIPATSAKLNNPGELIFDEAGNLFINDAFNHRIRKINSLGIITTYAGTGVIGYNGDGGLADTSLLSDGLVKVLVDNRGDLIIDDGNNYRVRKVSALTNIITTIAGNGISGFSGDGGPATDAQLFSPGHLAIDKIGNIYIADPFSKRVRKIDTLGFISTYAGCGIPGFSGDGGLADTAKFSTSILGLACDSLGNLYIADRLNGRIRKVDAITHIVTTIAGNGTGTYSGEGIAATSQGICPGGLAVDSIGNLFIADFLNMRVYKVTTSGIIYSVAGNGSPGYGGDGGPATAATLNLPYDIAFDPCGNLYLVDGHNNRIRKITFTPTCSLPLNVNIQSSNTGVKIFPNPAQNSLTITTSYPVTNITITNLVGQAVYTHQYKADKVQIDVADLPRGIYLVRINGTEVRKFVKQ